LVSNGTNEQGHEKHSFNLILTLSDRRAYPILIELKSSLYVILDTLPWMSGHIVFPSQLATLHSLSNFGSARDVAMTRDYLTPKPPRPVRDARLDADIDDFHLALLGAVIKMVKR
jgi:hypothetical protein